MSLAGKTIVVTGAASGIGAASARLLLERGVRVIGVDRKPTNLDEHFTADLRDPAVIDELVAGLPHGIDGLANVAGLPPTAPAADVLKVNLKAVQRLTTDLVPKMSDGASIVNLVSSAGNRWSDALGQIREVENVGWDDVEAFTERHAMSIDGRSYFFSKEALLVWTMRNGRRWIDRGIRMNAISPGPIDTPILDDFIRTLGPRAQRSLDATERVGTPEDVAPVVAFMLSDESAWLRGANVCPDGGLGAQMLMAEYGLD